MNKKLLKKRKQKLREKLHKRLVGYHVYRSEDESLPFEEWTRITDQPIAEGKFDDPAGETGKRYFYKLTQVFDSGEESAPRTPKSSFTDHAGNRFDQNPLKDFAGYNVYRSAERDVPLDKWEKRNSAPLPDTQFKDEGVKSGEVYFYFVRAVDSDGVESAPGEVIRVIRK